MIQRSKSVILLCFFVFSTVQAAVTQAVQQAARTTWTVVGSGSQGLDPPVCPPPPGAATAQSGPSPNDAALEENNLEQRRQQWFIDQRAYPLGYIPAGARLNALSQVEQMQNFRQALRQQGGLALPDGFSTQWKLIGPQPINIPKGEIDGTPYSAGRVTALAVDPTNADIVYAGTAEGGVWKTMNGGRNWTPLTDREPSLAVGSIAIDPTNCKPTCGTIYVGTGEENFSRSNYFGAGILKSVNGGVTWTQYGGPFVGPFGKDDGGSYIGSLAVNPKHSNVLLAGVEFSDQTKAGIYRSVDGGQKWEPVKTGSSGTAVMFYRGDADGNIVYAALGNSSGDENNGVYISKMGGQVDTWSPLNGTGDKTIPHGASVGRIAMAISPAFHNQLYVAMSDPRNSGLLGFWSSTDAGETWEKETNTPNYCMTQCYGDNVILPSPTVNTIVLAGGKGDTSNGKLTSVLFLGLGAPGGIVWKDVSSGANGINLHVDLRALAFSSDGRKLYVGTDGGVWSTTDLGMNYSNLNQSLAITQFYPGLSFGSDDNFSLAGTQDNGVTRYNGKLRWDYAVCGDGGWTAMSFLKPRENVYASCANSVDISHSTMGGDYNSWESADTGIDKNDRTNFVPPLVMDSDDPSILYFGTCRIWQTTTGGTMWTPKSADLTGGGAETISTIRVAPSNPDVVYVGTTDGRVSMTRKVADGMWDRIDKAPLPNRAVTQLAVRTTDPNTAIVAYSGFSGFNGDTVGHVFLTANGGGAWQDISGDQYFNLPNLPVNDIVIDPDLCGTYYAATDAGVFYTSDYGTRWQELTRGLPRVVVMSLKLLETGRIFRAATFGRSAWDITGTNNIPSGITLKPSSVELNLKVGQTTSRVFIFTNTCRKDLKIDVIRLLAAHSGPLIFSYDDSDCGSEFPIILGPNKSCKIKVSAAATEPGDSEAVLDVDDNALGSPQVVILKGKAVP